MEQLQTDLREFIRLLNEKNVEYVLIGAHAVTLHGHPRFTADIDFFIRQSEENAERVRDVIAIFFGGIVVDPKDFLVKDMMFRMGAPPNRVELLTSIAGVSFERAKSNSVTFELDGLPVHVIGLADLIENKMATGRVKDAEDARILKRRNKM